MNRSIDSSNIPDLLRIVEEVDATKTPRKLKRDNKIVAVISPVATHEKTTTKTEADYTTSLAAIGSWSDLPADEIIMI